MKFKFLATLSLAFLTIAGAVNAQQRTPPPPDVAAPGTNYDYHETFGPPFFTKNGNEYRAADGAPGPKYWGNRADYQLTAHLNDKTNEIVGSEILTYTNNSPQKLGFIWMQLDQNLFRQDSRGSAIVPWVSNPNNPNNPPQQISRNWGRGQVFDAGDKIKSVKLIDAKGGSTELKYVISDTRMQVQFPNEIADNGGQVKR